MIIENEPIWLERKKRRYKKEEEEKEERMSSSWTCYPASPNWFLALLSQCTSFFS